MPVTSVVNALTSKAAATSATMNVIMVCPAPRMAVVIMPPSRAATMPMRIVRMIPMC